MGGCKGPITTFIVEPFIPHNEEFYLNIVSDRLGNSVSFSECGGIDIEENWDKVLRQILFLLQIECYLCSACIKFSVYYP
jgi:succinyl-CoA synthetase beta subunit